MNIKSIVGKVCVFFVFAGCLVVGCSGDNKKNQILGSWECPDEKITFTEGWAETNGESGKGTLGWSWIDDQNIDFSGTKVKVSLSKDELVMTYPSGVARKYKKIK